MRCLDRNKQAFWYCLYVDKDEIVDDDGYETSEHHITYAPPVRMEANISHATGYSQTEQFGSLDNYDKVIVTDDMDCPITETTVLFVDKEPETTMAGDPMYDYIVRRVARSLNSISIAIRKVLVS